MEKRGGIITERLRLIPATVELCDAEAHGPEAVYRALRARGPGSWPPPVFEPDDVERIRRQLEADPAAEGWTLHYVLLRESVGRAEHELIGVAGYAGPPTEEGVVEVGYAVAEEYQRRGYATEAVKALVALAFEDSRVRVIRAHTYPALAPSIRVLEKAGFVRVGEQLESGVIRYEHGPPSHSKKY
jgi:ribosomal-protein-alanine N-acetyltransferase